MRLPGFIGPGYTLRNVNLDAQRCVNLYLEINELGTAAHGEKGALVSVEGTVKRATAGTGPIRGQFMTSTGRMVVVSGSEVYRIDPGWTPVLVGTLLTKRGRVSMADNGLQLIIVDGANGYIVSLSTGILTQIPAVDFPGATSVTFQDGYFICNNPNTGQFFLSGLYDGFAWDSLDYATAEGSPDSLVGVLSDRRQLWLPGSKTIEVWFNSGDANFPFSRIDGAYIEYGVIAPGTFIKFANTVAFLGGGPNAQGIVWMMEGYSPKRISNHGVELAIQGYSSIEDATAYSYQKDGHVFYVLNFPSANASWVFDIATGQWHERCYLGTTGLFERSRGECYAFAYGSHVVGDYDNGNIYELSSSVFSDDGNPLVRMRRSPHVADGMNRLFFHKFQLDARVGVGLDAIPAVGIDPQAMLRYSDDFGNTWSTEQSRSLGKLGEYSKRVIWRRLGQARTRVFEIKVSDPVDVTLLGAEIDVTAGVS